MRQLREVHYDQPPWSTRYPDLANLPDDQPGAPLRTCIERNVIASEAKGGISVGGKEANEMIHVANNLVSLDPGFVDAENGNYQLRKDSPAWKLGFQPIPLEKIGLQNDEYRSALPAQPPAGSPATQPTTTAASGPAPAN